MAVKGLICLVLLRSRFLGLWYWLLQFDYDYILLTWEIKQLIFRHIASIIPEEVEIDGAQKLNFSTV
jgi:hypothetical protein